MFAALVGLDLRRAVLTSARPAIGGGVGYGMCSRLSLAINLEARPVSLDVSTGGNVQGAAKATIQDSAVGGLGGNVGSQQVSGGIIQAKGSLDKLGKVGGG